MPAEEPHIFYADNLGVASPFAAAAWEIIEECGFRPIQYRNVKRTDLNSVVGSEAVDELYKSAAMILLVGEGPEIGGSTFAVGEIRRFRDLEKPVVVYYLGDLPSNPPPEFKFVKLVTVADERGFRETLKHDLPDLIARN